MLSLFQLQILPLNKQAQYIWDNGKFIDTKEEGNHTINLYLVHSYYAQVIYNTHSNQIEKVRLKDAFYNN